MVGQFPESIFGLLVLPGSDSLTLRIILSWIILRKLRELSFSHASNGGELVLVDPISAGVLA
jgi:hypothetical protein